jgi:hypothetical protein
VQPALNGYSAERVVAFIGTSHFLLVHGLWFLIWVAINTGLFAAALRFDDLEGRYDPWLLCIAIALAAITLYPDLWAAAVSTVGIANWESFLKNTSGYRRRQREVEYGMLDKDIDGMLPLRVVCKLDGGRS